jgi:hypothetical protein
MGKRIVYRCSLSRSCGTNQPCRLSIDSEYKGSMDIVIKERKCPLFKYEYSNFKQEPPGVKTREQRIREKRAKDAMLMKEQKPVDRFTQIDFQEAYDVIEHA